MGQCLHGPHDPPDRVPDMMASQVWVIHTDVGPALPSSVKLVNIARFADTFAAAEAAFFGSYAASVFLFRYLTKDDVVRVIEAIRHPTPK